ncbi:MAG: hypothetical protein LBV67_01790 [Streptococcaceae bacterium]|jgi:hypothetical protein|nr:hypothetical protein [Streptococcaceae bacterium]
MELTVLEWVKITLPLLIFIFLILLVFSFFKRKQDIDTFRLLIEKIFIPNHELTDILSKKEIRERNLPRLVQLSKNLKRTLEKYSLLFYFNDNFLNKLNFLSTIDSSKPLSKRELKKVQRYYRIFSREYLRYLNLTKRATRIF